MRWSVTAVLIAIAVAAADETHQAFVPSRTASPLDVLIDTCGAVLAQIAVFHRSSRPPRGGEGAAGG